MALEVRKITLLPRFTSLWASTSGVRTFRGAPIHVRDLASADVVVWRGPLLNIDIDPTLSFSAQIEESPDLTIWTANGLPLEPGENAEAAGSYTFELEWIRIAVTIGGSSFGAVTCWAVGNFTVRERARSEG